MKLNLPTVIIILNYFNSNNIKKGGKVNTYRSVVDSVSSILLL